MDRLGSTGDKLQPNAGKSAVDFGDTQRVDYDSQHSPVSGEENGVFRYLEDILPEKYLQDTLPIEEDIDPADDILITQQIDIDCEAEVVNPWEETQVVPDSEDEMEMERDDVDICCGKNVETQLISEGECVSDEEEVSDRTEALMDFDADGTDDVNLTVPSNDGALGIERTLDPHGEPGFKPAASSLTANEVSTSGSCKRDFTSVRAASLRASGLAARYKTTSNGDQYSEQCEEEGTTEMGKSRVSSSISRRLFTEEELDAHDDENEEHRDNNDDLASLSYLNSQEPGESSQAGALNYVDQLLANVFEYDQDATQLGNPGGSDKLDPPTRSGKGAQNLAKKVHDRHLLAQSDAYDFQDSLEDEGGGEFFVKLKNVLFGSQKFCPEPRKHRRRAVIKGRALENEEQKLENGHRRQMGVDHSESNLSKKTARKINQGTSGFNMRRRNLNNSMDEEVADPGLGTHMAAEDIHQARSNGANNSHQNEKKNCKVAAGSCALKHHSSPKRSHLEESRYSKRVKRLKRSSGHFAEASKSSVASRTRSKKDAINLLEAEADGQEKNIINISEVPKQNSRDEERDDGIAEGDLNDYGSVPAKHVHSGDEPNGSTPAACRKGKVGKLVCGSRNTSVEVRKNKGLSAVGSEGNKRRKTGESALTEEMAMKPNAVPDEMVPEKAVLQNDYTQVKVIGSNRTVGLFGGSSVGAAIAGQPIMRKQSNKRTIRSADLAKYAQHYARTAVLSLKLQSDPSSAGENGQCSSYFGKATNKKLPSIGSPVKMMTGPQPDVVVTTPPVNHGAHKESVTLVCMDSTGENDRGSSPCKTTETDLPMKTTKKTSDDVAVTTPVVNCKTPTEKVSPVCAGDEYYKQSSFIQNSAGVPSLVKELNQLTPFTPTRRKLSDKETRNRKRDMADFRVLFSHHLDDDIVRQQKKILARFGIPVASSILEATHFVTDEFVRTRNMLEAIAGGKSVVTHMWLESCRQAGCYLDENKYLLRDTRKEKEIGFSMSVSLARAREQPLLQGKKVLITPNTKPGLETLSSLVKAVHGQAMQRMGRYIFKETKIPDNLIILSCEEDYATCVPLLQKGAAVYSSELLLNGIVVQKLEFSRHQLFEDKVKRTRSSTRIKKSH